MSKLLENENGEIYIDNEVIAQFAGHAALDCFGIVGMASLSVKDGLAKLLKGDNVSRGVSVKMDDDGLYINFHIIVSYMLVIYIIYSYSSIHHRSEGRHTIVGYRSPMHQERNTPVSLRKMPLLLYQGVYMVSLWQSATKTCQQ